MTITCSCGCGQKRIVPECRGGLRFISRQHYRDYLYVERNSAVKRCIRLGLTDVEGSQAIGLSYRYYRKVRQRVENVSN